MYRRETKEKAAYAGNRTRRTDSVKQHEMAALREMEQMVLAAENSEGTAGLEKAVAHLESFLQQVRKTRILDEKQRAMEAFRESLRTAIPGAMAFCGTWLGLAADGRWQMRKAAESGTIPS